MSLIDLSKFLASIEGSVFIKTEPEVLDFTDKSIEKNILIFSSKNNNNPFVLSLSNIDFNSIISVLKNSIFSKGNKVICWNWKNLISYILYITKKFYVVDCALIDLKVIETYLGIKSKSPNSLSESLNRLKALIANGTWKEVENVYKNLHLPLMTTVLPSMETMGIIDTSSHNKLYSYYEINGQNNGRLKCSKSYSHGFVPHAMSDEFKQNLKTRNGDEIFMLFDFKGMEVYMLAWLSKDPLLLELCQTEDVYGSICKKIINENILKSSRELGKKIFLPVIYGQSTYSLSQECNIPINVAEAIYNKIHSLFPKCFDYVESYQHQLNELGYAKDFFGKRRTSFEVGKEYSVRNFAIQSPSSTVCLEKLTHLYFELKNKSDIAYTIHDGYVVYATKENWKSVYQTGFDILSSESTFCPGLRLRVTCRAGRNLNNLKLLSHRGEYA